MTRRVILGHASAVQRFDGGALAAAAIATSLGLASAAVSAYWALGGTALLDTVGGALERLGRERPPGVVVALWVIVVLKVLGAVAPLVFVGVGAGQLPAWATGRQMRLLGWLAAIGLTLYGGVLTVVGLLVQAGVIEAADDADEYALAWHAFVWRSVVRAVGRCIHRGQWRSRPKPATEALHVPWITPRARAPAPSAVIGRPIRCATPPRPRCSRTARAPTRLRPRRCRHDRDEYVPHRALLRFWQVTPVRLTVAGPRSTLRRPMQRG